MKNLSYIYILMSLQIVNILQYKHFGYITHPYKQVCSCDQMDMSILVSGLCASWSSSKTHPLICPSSIQMKLLIEHGGWM